MEQTEISYGDAGRFQGTLVLPQGAAEQPGERPAVLIAHAFGGISDFERERAQELAAEGYVALALDYYGKGRRAAGPEEAWAWMTELNEDRPELLRRMQLALATVQARPEVDASRIAAIGYCLGGKAVLDLARGGASVRGVASLHGVYDPPPGEQQSFPASVLALHGWDDPLATPEQLQEFAVEMSAHCRDWQLLAFGHTGHAFTNPAANAPDQGMMFNPRASQRAWRATLGFLAERFEAGDRG